MCRAMVQAGTNAAYQWYETFVPAILTACPVMFPAYSHWYCTNHKQFVNQLKNKCSM